MSVQTSCIHARHWDLDPAISSLRVATFVGATHRDADATPDTESFGAHLTETDLGIFAIISVTRFAGRASAAIWSTCLLAKVRKLGYNPFSSRRERLDGGKWHIRLGVRLMWLLEAPAPSDRRETSATDGFVPHCLPETLGGHLRGASYPLPGIYPENCGPQDLSARVVVIVIQAFLGRYLLAPFRLLLVDLNLPPCLPELRPEGGVDGLARVDLAVERRPSGKTRILAACRDCTYQILCRPPDVSILGRMSAALRPKLGC